MPRGPRGLLLATALTAGMGAFFAGLALPPTRSVLARLLPAPGEGPSKAQRDAGYFVTRHVGTSEPDAEGKTHRVLATIRGTSDPGYGETAKMLGEAALCLAFDDLPRQGGVTTPAASMGTRLIERLRAAGMTWQVEAFTGPLPP